MSMDDKQYEDLMEDIYSWSGGIASTYELAQWLVDMRPRLNELWAEEGQLVWIGYGFNEGDDLLTVNVEVR